MLAHFNHRHIFQTASTSDLTCLVSRFTTPLNSNRRLPSHLLIHLHIPEIPRVSCPTCNQPANVKRVNKRLPEPSQVLVSRSLDLSYTIGRKVNLITFWEIPTRVSHIEHDSITQHRSRLEYVEEPLIPDDGTYVLGIKSGPVSDLGNAKVLDQAIDCPRQDQGHTDVQSLQRAVEPIVLDSTGQATAVEGNGEEDE